MLTKHHIIPRSQFGSEHKHNIKMLEQKPHRRLHDFFGVSMPHEQVQKILNIAETALDRKALKEIRECIDDWGLDMYKSHCFRERNGILVPNRFSHNPPPPHGRAYD